MSHLAQRHGDTRITFWQGPPSRTLCLINCLAIKKHRKEFFDSSRQVCDGALIYSKSDGK